MKNAIIFGLLLAASAHAGAHALGRGPGGAPAGVSHGSASSSASASGSQGGRYTLGDEFQAWPQAEMQQYAKARWTPYAGK